MDTKGIVGLGLRREMLDELSSGVPEEIDFFEIAPENWLSLGGMFERKLQQISERHPIFCHGLSLSIGSPEPLDINFIKQVKAFLDKYGIEIYSEHLSYCSGQGHLYDLMPIPFTCEAVDYVAKRVAVVEDILERPLILENVSFYAAPGAEMSEQEFIQALLSQADCQLLLDVNNIYVNSVNHQYDPYQFLYAMPTDRIAYLHIAGHYQQASDLLIDTHGADIIDPVWQLLVACYQHHGIYPTLLERDFNIPPMAVLVNELAYIHQLQSQQLTSIGYDKKRELAETAEWSLL